jgi:hypothetical protein
MTLSQLARRFIFGGTPAVQILSPEEQEERLQKQLEALVKFAVSLRSRESKFDGIFTTLSFREAVQREFEMPVMPERPWAEKLLLRCRCVRNLGVGLSGTVWQYEPIEAQKETPARTLRPDRSSRR